jgi:HlyD family secretion protein
MRKRLLPVLIVLLLLSGGVYYAYFMPGPDVLVLTGIVTTQDVIVGPQIGGQITRLHVKEGDEVKRDQLVAEIAPDELRADRAYAEHSAAGMASQVQESEAALRYQQRQLSDTIRQAEAQIAAAVAQQAEATANLENAQLVLNRTTVLVNGGAAPAQDLDAARTSLEAVKARVNALERQVEMQRATLALARSDAEQVSLRRSAVKNNESQLAAAGAQRTKADVRLAYTQVHAPIDGVVDVRVAREGEVVGAAQPIITLINQDDLWVRVDIEETYIDRIRNGDTLTVRFPSGEERQGTVFYRRVDGSFATQRDVSRTKRDIRTFEVRLRVDNTDRRLAVGMTMYVMLPVR